MLIQGKVQGIKKRQAPFIAPLQPSAFAAFRPWRIGQELVVKDLPFDGKNTQVSTFRRMFFSDSTSKKQWRHHLHLTFVYIPSMEKKLVQHGIIIGIVVSLYMALLYAAGLKYLSNWWLTVLMYPISITMLCYFTVQLRNHFPDKSFTYGRTFVTILSMAMIATLVSTLWNIILFNVIDKALAKEISNLIIEQTREMMENWGTPDSAMKETLKGMKDLPAQFKPLAQLKSWLSGGIFLAIVAAICAAFLKRKTTFDTSIKA